MIKKLILFFIFSFFVFSSLYFLVMAEEKINSKNKELKIEGKKIDYLLPYPGLLPDHPLYFLKAVRDRILDFLTRDYHKKAQLYLLYSDKRTNMGIYLSQKEKWNLMISTLSKGEKYSLKMIEVLEEAKKQGNGVGNDFILRAKLSNEKHREVIENLLKVTPQGKRHELKAVLDLNDEIRKKLNLL